MATSKKIADAKVKHEKKKKSTIKTVTKHRQPSTQAIIEAINGTGGIVTQIAERLSISRQTVYKHISTNKTVREAYEDEKDCILDIAEEGLLAKIYSQDFDAIKYYLERKGKSRGYGGQDQFGKSPETVPCTRESGVLVTPGLLSEDAWETTLQK